MTPAELRAEAEGWLVAINAPGANVSRVNLERFVYAVIDLTRAAEANEVLSVYWAKKHTIAARRLAEVSELAENSAVHGQIHGAFQWHEGLKTIASLSRNPR